MSTEQPTPLSRTCLNCKHVRTGFLGMLADTPDCSQVTRLNLVTGKTEYRPCGIARTYECGAEARLWEPKPVPKHRQVWDALKAFGRFVRLMLDNARIR